ncbi:MULTISPECIES: DUF6126 family protein [Streptomyces]|uniref:Small hydrophobic protein n=1 Tax=Streptomyces californicus TaxID=67351 RepID=A0ABD7CSN6_9ACTN|nr:MULTISPECIES: DUF6126 family protein [Streptomyces]MBD3550528.1 hypothetical protein [Streptomyces sp. JV180]MBD3552104.1 hypothetical protein [Streptomyces sp. SP18CM02]MBK0373189.1 hypothetical protein [Streptomyces sp. RB110-1]MBK0390443.1 hypothetical protein [Streptomyces sp. RB110-2]MCC0575914.1 DUF6126 family protein [Streptomyces californicus]
MSDSEHYDPLGPGRRVGEDPQEKRMPRGLVIRLFAYLVAGHVVAAFLYVLFVVAGSK